MNVKKTHLALLAGFGLLLYFAGSLAYHKVNYRVVNARVLESHREVVGIRIRPRMNEPLWGTRLVVEFRHEGRVHQSTALVRGFPRLAIGERIAIRFNQRAPDTCHLVERPPS